TSLQSWVCEEQPGHPRPLRTRCSLCNRKLPEQRREQGRRKVRKQKTFSHTPPATWTRQARSSECHGGSTQIIPCEASRRTVFSCKVVTCKVGEAGQVHSFMRFSWN